MYTKIIFLLIALYVVNASVISQDTYDDIDGDISELSSDLTDLADRRICFNRLCNIWCRIKRYANGTCVKSQCRCQNRVYRLFDDDTLDDPVAVSGLNEDEVENEAFYNEVVESEQNLNKINADDTEAEIGEKRRCIPRLCSILCRLRRFNNGTCVNNRCRCWNNARRSFADEILDDISEKSGLNVEENEVETFPYEVEKARENFSEHFEDFKAETGEKRRCIPRLCSILCRLKRFNNGTCVNNRCNCWNNNTEARIAELFFDPTDLGDRRRCFNRFCNLICRFKRFGNGTCVEGRCRCSN